MLSNNSYIIILITSAIFLMSSCGSGENGDRERDHEYLPDQDTVGDERVEHPPDTLDHTDENTLAMLREKISDDPDNPEWYYQRAAFYQEQGKLNLARNDIESALKRDSSNPKYFKMQGQLYWDLDLPSSSIEALKEAIERFPENTDLLVQLADYKMILTRHEESMKLTHQALEIDPNISEAYLIRGINFKERDMTDRAMSSLHTAVDIDPENHEAYELLGLIAKEQGDQRAVHYLNNALQFNPQLEEALYARGKLHQEAGNLEAAREDYLTLLEINAEQQQAHYNLAYVNLLMGNNEEAVDHFTQSIRLTSGHALSYYGRGLAFKYMDDTEEARKDFEKVLELDSEFNLAREELTALEN